MREGRPWRYGDVQWGLTPCQTTECPGDAEVFIGPDTRVFDAIVGPVCLDCADRWLERTLAVQAGLGRGWLVTSGPYTGMTQRIDVDELL